MSHATIDTRAHGLMSAGTFGCACRFNRAVDFGEAKLIEPCNFHKLMQVDAERWQAGKRLGFPQFCGHDTSQPSGTCWYVELKQENDTYQSADEAMDAAIKNNPIIDRDA